jgi:ATP-dependent Lon protease
MKLILFPDGNVKDLEEIPAEVRERVKMVPVKLFSEVAALALGPAPAVLPEVKPVWAAPGNPVASPKQPPHSGGVA